MTIHDPNHGDCPNCGRSATVVRPSRLWSLLLVPAYATCAGMVLGGAMLGFGLLMVVPFVLAGGACLLSALHAKASEEPMCGACGKIANWTSHRSQYSSGTKKSVWAPASFHAHQPRPL